MNSLKGWMLYQEIEFLKFPKITKNKIQDIDRIKSLLEEIGEFDLYKIYIRLITN